jgi:N-acetylglucosamine kinase-like BadF-type ATPase
MSAAVLAIDGGNSKTDVVLVAESGSLLAHVRGPGSSPHHLGVEGSATLLDGLVSEAAGLAGVAQSRDCASHAGVYLAGVDIAVETEWIKAAIDAKRWAPSLVVENDTMALLRAGTDDPNAVAVVCGAGINCAGVSADGRQVRFPSLGRISGDWGGGGELGEEALWWAARADDGRAGPTAFQNLIPQHFGRTDITEVIEDLHFGRLPESALGQLAPVVLAAASQLGDEVAVGIVRHLAEEVVILAVTALRRLHLLTQPSVVVLGGGVLTGADPLLHRLIHEGLAVAAPKAVIQLTTVPPVVGAALLGMDQLHASEEVERRIRESFSSGTVRQVSPALQPRLSP